MISGIYTALSGMNAHRRILDATSHNVANQSTPGYRRQRVDLAPSGIGTGAAVFTGMGSQLRGVDVVGTTRVLDAFAETRALREQATAADTATSRDAMLRIEQIFPEPSEFGIANQLDELWSAWSDVATRPEDETTRAAVLGRAQGVVDALGRASRELDVVAGDARTRLGAVAVEINDLAERIARLNASAASSTGSLADVYDKRDLLVNRLAELTGATVRPGVGGQIEVDIAGRSLVSGPIAQRVEATDDGLTWSAGGHEVRTPTGEVAGLQRVVRETIPRYRAELDAVAETLVTKVNELHREGYDLDGGTGLDFFDPAGVTADTISISGDVAGSPRRLAAGAPVLPGPTAPGPFDGSNAERIAAIVDGADSPDDGYRAFVTGLGIETRTAVRRAETQSIVASSAIDDASSASGVSLDEEMVNLVQAQRGYEAAARVLTAVDELLGVLLERTGLVGR